MTPPIVKRYLIALDKYKWIGLASFGLVMAGSTVFAVKPEPPKVYQVGGILSYDGPLVSFSTTGTQIQQQGQVLTEEIFSSPEVINPVAEKVKVKANTIVNNFKVELPKKGKGDDRDSPSGLIKLSYQDTDKQRATQTLKALMDQIVNQSAIRNSSTVKKVINQINERVPDARRELQAAERRLEVYDRTQGPAILAAENQSLLGSIASSQNQQQQIRLTLTGIDAKIRSLQAKLGLTANQAYVSSALSADPILADLRRQIYEAESQMELLKKDLRPEHPTMVQLRRSLETSEQLLRQRASEVLGGDGAAAPLTRNSTAIRTQSNLDPARLQLANELVTLETQRETLRQQMVDLVQAEQQYRQQYSSIPNKQLERSRLEQQVALKRALYDQMQAKLVDAKTAEAETVSSLKKVTQEPFDATPATQGKNLPVTFAIGGLLGVLVGGGVIFLLGALESTFKTMEDIREFLRQREVSLLGILPLMPTWDLTPDMLPVISSPDSPNLELYERFRSNLRRLGGNNLKVVLITSTNTHEGKSVSAYNLGIASARAGKRTLIVETDLRSPTRCQSLKVTPDPNASAEPLRYYATMSECVRLVPEIENLYILPSPGPLRHAAAILESSEMRRLMEDVRGRFDLVILDTATLSLSNDALLLQPYSDGIVLVTRPGYTDESLLAETIDQFTESDLPLLGAIINGADIVPPSRPPATLPPNGVSANSAHHPESEEAVYLQNN